MPPRPTPLPLLRVPYTDPLPAPKIIPASASTASGAIAALIDFLLPSLASRTAPPCTASPSSRSSASSPWSSNGGKTLLLTGAGISVASGLADYRGSKGTYTLNRSYKPIYFNEFCSSHEARKRYWARSFLGWTTMERAKPNKGHEAVKDLGGLGVVSRVITQNVDSFHPLTHPSLPTLELHGALRTLTCLTCATPHPRSTFQTHLAALNPAWSAFLQRALASGALATEHPAARSRLGLKTNPDGDVDIPNAPYTTFRYPACPVCLERGRVRVEVDSEGGWKEGSEGGVLKPAVIMFGESIPADVKIAAEQAVDGAGRLLVVGSSLATYSAWRLVKRAKERGMPIGILNIRGVRGEESFFADVPDGNTGGAAVRVSLAADSLLPQVVKILNDMKK